ncbi:MAG TPA: hypothetical protein V6C65_09795, partial [Allocoleopsis sp.]
DAIQSKDVRIDGQNVRRTKYVNHIGLLMVTLSDDEVALIRSILTALRGIKVRDIDKAMVILSKGERQS